MLIWEMAFVFHKSKQAITKATLKKLSKTIIRTEVSLCSNKRFCSAVVVGQIRFRPHDSCPTICVSRNLPACVKCSYIDELQIRH